MMRRPIALPIAMAVMMFGIAFAANADRYGALVALAGGLAAIAGAVAARRAFRAAGPDSGGDGRLE